MAEQVAVLTDEAFEGVLQEMRDLRKRKKADYNKPYADDGSGLGNLRKAGWEGVVIRLQDKLDRLNGFALQSVVEGEAKPLNESVEDSFVDGAIYNILGLICYRARVSWRKDKAQLQEGSGELK